MASADERISLTVNGNRATWRIDEPNVGQRETQYPMITFQPGDQVLVDAGGCVQTGGSGRTWKRYVDPQGPDSDRLYHGLIEIPGATAPPGSLIRIAGVMGQSLTVNGPSAARFPLILGYEDDNYSDNGYWGHDDGTGDQCKNVGDAWVVVQIIHPTPGSRPPPPPPALVGPFNLEWVMEDPSLIPINSLWSYQEAHPFQLPNPSVCLGMPDKFSNGSCSVDHPTTDTPDIDGVDWVSCNIEFPPIPGHVNWWASTYDGSLTWDGHSFDDDYNFKLPSHLQFGEVITSGGSLGVEFDSDETIDHFQTPWWSSFHQAVDQSDSAAAAMVNGKYAIVTGLVGLDCEHDCHTELHPVFGMAIHVKDDPADDVWAIFARNWGDEGWCSTNQHYLDVNSVYFHLPWRFGASQVSVLNKPDNSDRLFLTNDARVSGPGIQSAVNQGILVSFNLPAPDAGARLNGELHLQWSMPPMSLRAATQVLHVQNRGAQSSLGPIRTTSSTIASRTIQNIHPAGRIRAEEQLAGLYASLPESEKKRIQGGLIKPVVRDAVPLRPFKYPILRLTALAARPPRHARPAMRTVRDPAKAARDTVKLRALCAAYGNNLPGLPGACYKPPAQRVR
jgi:hypothetical protein